VGGLLFVDAIAILNHVVNEGGGGLLVAVFVGGSAVLLARAAAAVRAEAAGRGREMPCGESQVRTTNLQQPQNWQGFKAEAGGGRRRRVARARRSGGRNRGRMVCVQCGDGARMGLLKSRRQGQGLSNAWGNGWGGIYQGIGGRGGGLSIIRGGGVACCGERGGGEVRWAEMARIILASVM
jgi:hypothetical protein